MMVLGLILSTIVALLALGYLVSLFIDHDPAPPGWDEYPSEK